MGKPRATDHQINLICAEVRAGAWDDTPRLNGFFYSYPGFQSGKWRLDRPTGAFFDETMLSYDGVWVELTLSQRHRLHQAMRDRIEAPAHQALAKLGYNKHPNGRQAKRRPASAARIDAAVAEIQAVMEGRSNG